MSAGHSLVLVWALWQGLQVWVGPMDTRIAEDSTIVRTYDSEDACLKAAISKRRTRNAILRRYQGEDQVGIWVWACTPTGADPTLATFE
jgi:hypothetical protein